MILGLAPMDGVTDSAMRIITKKIFDQHNKNPKYKLFLRTEFMSANGYCINPTKVARHIFKTNYETPLIVQIFGGDEKYLIQSSIDIQNKYKNKFYGLELNLGCPVNKVVNNGGGAGMLKDRKETLKIIKKIREYVYMPFSIKTRTGLNIDDKKKQMDFLTEASQYCDMIIIHGRTLKAGYSGDCDRDFIYKLKENIKNTFLNRDGSIDSKVCKIIGNGGIKYFQDIETFLLKGESKTLLDGMMIGQAAIGNPWIFTDYKATLEDKKEIILTHLDISIKMEIEYKKQNDNHKKGSSFILEFKNIEEIESTNQKEIEEFEQKHNLYSLLEFRKHLFNYVKGIENSKEFKIKCAKINKYQELKDEINKFFDKCYINNTIIDSIL